MDRDLFQRFITDIKKIYERKWLKGNVYSMNHRNRMKLPWLEKNRKYSSDEKRTIKDFIDNAVEKDNLLIEQLYSNYYFLYENFELMERAFKRAYERMYN